MQLKRVDLPAPFGPIRPRISPRRSSKEMSPLATRPPNSFTRFFTSSIIALPCPFFPHPLDNSPDPLRLFGRNHHHDHSVNHKIDAQTLLRSQPGPQVHVERNENGRSDDGPPDRTRSSHHHGQDRQSVV